MKCPKCNSQLLLDHVTEEGSTTNYWYCCINPKCSKKGIAFKPTGEETEAKIKPPQ